MKIIDTTNINELRKQIQLLKNSEKEIIVQAKDENFNRYVLEKTKADILLSPELHDNKDFMKQRNSGLNEFLCKLARKNNISIGIEIDKIKKLEKKQKAAVLARIKQNINLCKRTKTKLIIWPKDKYTKQEIMDFMISLGSSTKQAKDAV